MIAFLGGFESAFAPNATFAVTNNTQDDPNKPICGGMAFPNAVRAAWSWALLICGGLAPVAVH